MDGEFPLVKGVVNLSSKHVLDRAELFLTAQGYKVMSRTDKALTVKRRKWIGLLKRSILHLTLFVEPQPQGGVVVKVQGDDREGVIERQAAWAEWAKTLPKKANEDQKQLLAHIDKLRKEVARLNTVWDTVEQPPGEEISRIIRFRDESETFFRRVEEARSSVTGEGFDDKSWLSRATLAAEELNAKMDDLLKEQERRRDLLKEGERLQRQQQQEEQRLREQQEKERQQREKREKEQRLLEQQEERLKETRQQLLAKSERLEQRVANLNSVWDTVRQPTKGQIRKVNGSRAPAERLLTKVNKAAKTSVLDKGFNNKDWLSKTTSLVEELTAKINNVVEEGERRLREQQEKERQQREKREKEQRLLKETRQQLQTEIGKLRQGIVRLNAEWERAQNGRAEPFTLSEDDVKYEAERWIYVDSQSGNKRTEHLDNAKFLNIWLKQHKGATSYYDRDLEERLTVTKKRNKELERCLEARQLQSLARKQRSYPDYWAPARASGQPYELKKLKQRIKDLQARLEESSERSQTTYHPLFDEGAADASPAEDTSAKLLVQADADPSYIRFECNEYQKDLRTNVEILDLLKRMQQFEPLHVTAKGNVEWWWFQDKFCRVPFEEGQPSAQLAEAIAVGDIFVPKESLDDFRRVGRSSKEVANSVFETRGKREDDLVRAVRADGAKAVREQWQRVLSKDRQLDAQTLLQGDDLQPDLSAKLCTRKDETSVQVYFESNVHHPPLVLSISEKQFAFASKLQNQHPLLVTKLVGRGRTQSSEAVAEWWWFQNLFYVAKRARDLRSDALVEITEQELLGNEDKSSGLIYGWANAPIPKLCVDAVEDVYEEGYAPEEIVRLVFASQGKREKPEDEFGRIQAAKDLLNRSPVCKQLWKEEVDAYYQRKYEQYLEAKIQGYSADYQQWMVNQNREPIREVLSSSSENSEVLIEGIARRDKDLDRVNYMEGSEFEWFMADILSRSGYTVESTKLSGDQGVDILLTLDSRKIAVQLKRYTRPVGNKAVQEVSAGRFHYRTDEAWVITTSSFTKSAVELARSASVRLIDGNELREWLIELNG